MAKTLQDRFDALAKGGLITSVDVVRIVESYGLAFTRKTLQKWGERGIIDVPMERCESQGTGHRVGYSYDDLLKILTLRLTLGALSGLGKGSRLKKRFATVSAALKFCEGKSFQFDSVATTIDLKAIPIANEVINHDSYTVSPIKHAKVIKLVALIFCLYRVLLTQDKQLNIVTIVKAMTRKGVFKSINDAIGIKESSLSKASITHETAKGVECILKNANSISSESDWRLLLAWVKCIRFLDTNGWVAELAEEGLGEKGYEIFTQNAKANWMACVLLDE